MNTARGAAVTGDKLSNPSGSTCRGSERPRTRTPPYSDASPSIASLWRIPLDAGQSGARRAPDIDNGASQPKLPTLEARRRMRKPTRLKPLIINIQVDGSGTAAPGMETPPPAASLIT
jgi:hypothetical protein